ncbi:MAG TPA: 2-C-methyl-D-erythritol 4-phosphate cytidylyltransferase [Chthoniobacterales bacterium]|nr:2-C-methyl-D-erythritol 4-phosphate cytidylyltransferase [Chthoniobacterales bacterium]
MLTAIIVAAGSSQRFGFDKLTAVVAGKPVVVHTVEAFEGTSSVDDIIIVTRADRIEEFEDLLGSAKKISAIVAGGAHRHDSVQAGLQRISDSATFVAVHDAARPLVTPAQIHQVFEQARVHNAATLAEPVRDTLKRVDSQLMVVDSVDRQNVYAMQTPQIFDRGLLEKAYRQVAESGQTVTDEVSAIQLLGKQIALVENPEPNFKITYERDLSLAEAVLLRRQIA